MLLNEYCENFSEEYGKGIKNPLMGKFIISKHDGKTSWNPQQKLETTKENTRESISKESDAQSKHRCEPIKNKVEVDKSKNKW